MGWRIDNVELPDGTLKPVAAYGDSEGYDGEEYGEEYDEECELELAERMREDGNEG